MKTAEIKINAQKADRVNKCAERWPRHFFGKLARIAVSAFCFPVDRRIMALDSLIGKNLSGSNAIIKGGQKAASKETEMDA